jgi:CRISPR-associated protein Cas2
LVAYDIRDSERLRRVHRTMLGYGDRVQYSVFLCDLSSKEKVLMKADLSEEMNLREDRVLIVDMGPTRGGGPERVEFLGETVEVEGRGPGVV